MGVSVSPKRHDPWTEEVQYRVAVQRYSSAPPEVSIRRHDFGAENDRIMSAYRRGVPVTSPGQEIHLRSWNARQIDEAERAAENRERSSRRAQSMLRKTIRELAPHGLLTLTSRRLMPDRDTALATWQHFKRAVRLVDPDFAAVVVPEHHADDFVHLHAAYRGLSLKPKALRRLWHISLTKVVEGRTITRTRVGADSPGNIDLKGSKYGPVINRTRRIGRFIAKYLGKDTSHADGHRKAYWATDNVKLQAPDRFWIVAGSYREALEFAVGQVGYPPEVLEFVSVFHPEGSNVWHVDFGGRWRPGQVLPPDDTP